MNFSAFFVLAVTLCSVVFAQEQNNDNAQKFFEAINEGAQENQDADIFVNATLTLKNGFTRGTQYIEQSEKTINDAITEAQNSIDNPEAAKEILAKGIALTMQQISQSVPDYFSTFGEALALSCNGAEQGLRDGGVLLQKAGLSILDQLEIAQNLMNFGIDAKDFAAEILIQAIRLTVETGYTGLYHNGQESIKTAYKALRDAEQAGPNAPKIQNTNCDAARDDSDGGSDAFKEINDAADDALASGSDSELVEELRNTFICALGDIAIATGKGKDTVLNLKPLAESDPKAAIEKYYNTINGVIDVVHKTTVQIDVAIGDVAAESANQSPEQIGQALDAVELGKIQITRAVNTGGKVLETGLRYKGDTPSETVDAVARVGYYAKLALLQGIVKAFKLVSSVV